MPIRTDAEIKISVNSALHISQNYCMTCKDSENSAYQPILFYFCGHFAAVFIEKSGQDILQKFYLSATQKSIIWVVNVKRKIKLSKFGVNYPFNKHLSLQRLTIFSYKASTIFFVLCAVLFKHACVCMSESVGESVPSCVHRGERCSQGEVLPVL